MSFGDISRNAWAPAPSPIRPVLRGDSIAEIGLSIQNLQRECEATKETISLMKRKKIGSAEKTELTMKIKTIRDSEAQLKQQIDVENSKLDSIPRTEAAAKRVALGKLMKDFDKVKVNVQVILNESSLVKVVNERGEIESFARTGSATNSATSSQKSVTGSSINSNVGSNMGSAVNGNTLGSSVNGSFANGNQNNRTDANRIPVTYVDEPPPPMTRQQQREHLQQLKLQPVLQGQEVDDAILEEREREIKKIHHDIVLVNEMMQDMAQLVDTQGVAIREIATAVDNSHERTQAGLEQVAKAAEYQPGCVIC